MVCDEYYFITAAPWEENEFGFVMATSDGSINIHQLQLVSDHLSEPECAKLKSALHQTDFVLNETAMAELQEIKENKPCIFYLLVWDRVVTSDKPLNDLTIRLKQIGREDLADKLAESVFEEETETLEKNFLDNPFKKYIPKHSVLLAMDEEQGPEDVPDDTDKRLTGWEIFSIVIATLTLVAAGVAVIYKLFGELIKRLFKQYAPDFLVQWTDMVCGECKWFCKKTKRRFEKNVIGIERKKPDRKTVMEMNRNLNNYLNGHFKDAFYYFQDVQQ